MKKVLFISALVLTSSFAFSQTNKDGRYEKPMKGDMPNPEQRMKEHKDRMAKELNLTEAQIQQINAIDDRYKAQEETLRNQSEALREQRYQLKEQKRAEVEKVFTEEQKQKLKDMREKFHNGRKGPHGKGPQRGK